jgi:hypothetical protein
MGTGLLNPFFMVLTFDWGWTVSLLWEIENIVRQCASTYPSSHGRHSEARWIEHQHTQAWRYVRINATRGRSLAVLFHDVFPIIHRTNTLSKSKYPWKFRSGPSHELQSFMCHWDIGVNETNDSDGRNLRQTPSDFLQYSSFSPHLYTFIIIEQ